MGKLFGQKNIIILGLIFILAVMIRLWFVSGDNVVFFWDQARDAILSREILEMGDVKILGPSASGTEDQVYHGVMFYYIIGPLYTLFGGNPMAVTMVLGVVNALGVLVLYKLGAEVLQSKKIGLVSAFLFAVSAHSVFYGTWLSNPTTAIVTVGLFYLFLYRAVFSEKYWNWLWVALFLGMTNQAAVFTIYLWLAVGVGNLWLYHKDKLQKVSWKVWGATVGVYMLAVGTMVVGELMLWQRGILNGAAYSKLAVTESAFDALLSIVNSYIRTIAQSGLPQYPTLSAVVGIAALVIFLKQKSLKVKIWGWIFLSAPLLLLLIITRRDGHNLIGMMPLIYLAVGYVLVQIKQKKLYVVLGAMVLGGYAYFNISYLAKQKIYGDHPFVLQKGVTVANAKQMMDYMYTKADGEEFSFSSLTNPLGMNTTWAYLFDWYGKSKYGYAPTFVGPVQTGLFGAGLLQESRTPLPLHFSVLEPSDIIRKDFVEAFEVEQLSLAGKVKSVERFRELMVQERVR